MIRKNSYGDFQDQIFREIDDIQSERNRYILAATCREFGLTFDEAVRLYYKQGMTGQQFLDALRTSREKE